MKLNTKNVLCVMLILFLGVTVAVSAEESKVEESKAVESSPIKIVVRGSLFVPLATKIASVDPSKGFGVCCHIENFRLNLDCLKGENASENYPGMSVDVTSSLTIFSVQYVNILPGVNGNYYGAGIGRCVEKAEVTVEYEYYGRIYTEKASASESLMILELVAGYVGDHLDLSARLVMLPSSENVTSALLCSIGYRF